MSKIGLCLCYHYVSANCEIPLLGSFSRFLPSGFWGVLPLRGLLGIGAWVLYNVGPWSPLRQSLWPSAIHVKMTWLLSLFWPRHLTRTGLVIMGSWVFGVNCGVPAQTSVNTSLSRPWPIKPDPCDGSRRSPHSQEFRNAQHWSQEWDKQDLSLKKKPCLKRPRPTSLLFYCTLSLRTARGLWHGVDADKELAEISSEKHSQALITWRNGSSLCSDRRTAPPEKLLLSVRLVKL